MELATYGLSEEEFDDRDINELCRYVSALTTLEELGEQDPDVDHLVHQASCELDELTLAYKVYENGF